MENKLKLKNLDYAEELEELCKVSAELKNRPLKGKYKKCNYTELKT